MKLRMLRDRSFQMNLMLVVIVAVSHTEFTLEPDNWIEQNRTAAKQLR